MLQEIINFTNEIIGNDPDYLTRNLRPSDGLHILITLDSNGYLPIDSATELPEKSNYRSILISKEGENGDDWGDIALYEYYSGWIESNKPVDSKKKIHSSTPYALWFKKENSETTVETDNVQFRFEGYFKTLLSYYEKTEEIDTAVKHIIDFCKSGHLLAHLKSDKFYKEGDDSLYVKIYFVQEEDFLGKLKNSQKKYLDKKLFLKNNYNITIDEKILGLSGFMNNMDDKKPFLKHKTSSFLINARITKNDSYTLFLFEKTLKTKPRKLPTPLPIFIDKKELNQEMIFLFNKEGSLSTMDIFRSIIENTEKKELSDVGSYLLLNWNNTKDGLIIYDADYVANFRYHFPNPMQIKRIVREHSDSHTVEKKINTILGFESIILTKIFVNALVTRTKEGGFIRKYFGEINKDYCTDTTYNNIIRYRKAFYDYIYKSRDSSITPSMWYDILWSEIRDSIKRDGLHEQKIHSTRELLDTLFSLNKYFDKNNTNFGGNDMPSLLPELRNKIRDVINSKGEIVLENDLEFCFAAGQLMSLFVYLSKSQNKTHALIEPYISKTQFNQFQLALANGFNKYKHEIKVYGKGRGDILASQVFIYSANVDLQKKLPIILAGYLSVSLVFEKVEKITDEPEVSETEE